MCGERRMLTSDSAVQDHTFVSEQTWLAVNLLLCSAISSLGCLILKSLALRCRSTSLGFRSSGASNGYPFGLRRPPVRACSSLHPPILRGTVESVGGTEARSRCSCLDAGIGQ